MIDDSINQVIQDPLNPQAHRQLADAYALKQHWFAAIAEYRTALTLGLFEPSVWLALARAYLAAGLVDPAISIGHNLLSQTRDPGPTKTLAQSLKRLWPDKERDSTQLASTFKQEITNLLAMAQTTPTWSLSSFNHNRYYRLKTLADHLFGLFGDSDFSVLDVGGGDGALAVFIPQARYALAEPGTNGISGINLPFAAKSFDVVIACHVLEHIPQAGRPAFLDQICQKASKYLLLLNPFFSPAGHVTERIQLIYELTQAQWAKEHLECGLPQLDEVTAYAASRNYPCQVWPNGSLTTSLAMVFVDYYAMLAGRETDLEKIHNLFNTRFFTQLTDPKLPTAYLVELRIN